MGAMHGVPLDSRSLRIGWKLGNLINLTVRVCVILREVSSVVLNSEIPFKQHQTENYGY